MAPTEESHTEGDAKSEDGMEFECETALTNIMKNLLKKYLYENAPKYQRQKNPVLFLINGLFDHPCPSGCQIHRQTETCVRNGRDRHQLSNWMRENRTHIQDVVRQLANPHDSIYK